MFYLIFTLLLSSQSFSSDLTKACFSIQGMMCGSCREKIETKLKKTPFINSVEVSLQKELSEVSYDASKMSDAKIISLIQEAGYQAKSIECQK